ncbi:unnamed protein product [Lactuca saligna]|uniref:Uncharacterized protein n=1 Tax=Lactuca saligna TaxID=75948 RepID=A0AA35Z705_LACSI|nr:unnamed protein product [Lactuca saligna]
MDTSTTLCSVIPESCLVVEGAEGLKISFREEVCGCYIQLIDNEDLQPLLARRPGCSPKEIFSLIHEKLPTISYESCIDAEIQQRAVEYFALSRKGEALMDILAEMPKFPERQPIGDIAERFHALCLKDSGVLYEDPCVQIGFKAEWRNHQGRLVYFWETKIWVQCPLEIVNLRPSRDVPVLDFSYKFGSQLIFFIVVVVRGVRAMSLGEMKNLFNTLRLMVCPGLVEGISDYQLFADQMW